MSIEKLFPTYLYSEKLGGPDSSDLRSDLLKECLKIREIDEEGEAWSKLNYVGGYTSYGSMDRLHDMSPNFARLKKLIDRHVKKYIKAAELDVDTESIHMNSCWVNIMPTQAHHSYHIHPLSFLSGTFYVSVPKSSSVIKFEDPRLGFFMGTPPRKKKCRRENQHFVSISPRDGQVLLFESWLRHEVPANMSRKPRISISFNYSW